MPLFTSESIEITPAASAALMAVGADQETYLARHWNADWGNVDADTWQDNDFAMRHNQVICSQYKLSDGSELQIITLGDRSSTYISLASERPVRKVSTQAGYALWSVTYDSDKNGLIALEEPYVDAILATLPITTALDVGAGTGRYALKLARRGIAVTAIDQSPEMLAIAQDAARREGLPINFHSAALEQGLPYEEGTFDFLICALVLCHVPDLFAAVKEFARVIQPGGYLLITDFHDGGIEQGWRTLIERAGMTYVLPKLTRTRNGYTEALTRNGLHIIKSSDLLVHEVPEGYISQAFRDANMDKDFCLILLPQKRV